MAAIYASARVTTVASIRRHYKLTRGFVPKVIIGQTVHPAETLAVALVALDHRILNLAEMLGVSPQRVAAYLTKREGDLVEQGEVLATRRVLLGLRRRRVLSPIDGRVLRVENGQMLLEGPRTRIEVQATVPGKVVDLEAGEFVLVETTGAAIQVAWGSGGLAWGTLKVLDTMPSTSTDPSRFTIDHRGAVVAIGSPLTAEFLRGAVDIRVRGLIASSAHASLLPLLTNVDFPIALTQGFGVLPMSERILALLNTYNGREVALDMGGDNDWREQRPEIIIPLASQAQQKATPDLSRGELRIAVGQKVRVLQPPYLGEIGTVTGLPDAPQRVESGLWVHGAEVQMPSSEVLFVPFANLEYLG